MSKASGGMIKGQDEGEESEEAWCSRQSEKETVQ